MPTPSVPSGPGSIHEPSLLTGMIFAAVATMSPPSPITTGSPRVSSQSRTSRHRRWGSIGVSSLSSAAWTFASAASSTTRSSSRQPEKSMLTPRVLHLLEQQLEGVREVADEADVGLAVLADQRRVHVELDDLGLGRDRLAEAHAEVEQRAGQDDAVGLLERVAPRAVQELRRARRHAAAAHAVRVGGDVGLADEAVQLLAGARPLHAGARHQHRAPGAFSSSIASPHLRRDRATAAAARSGSAESAPSPPRPTP